MLIIQLNNIPTAKLYIFRNMQIFAFSVFANYVIMLIDIPSDSSECHARFFYGLYNL